MFPVLAIMLLASQEQSHTLGKLRTSQRQKRWESVSSKFSRQGRNLFSSDLSNDHCTSLWTHLLELFDSWLVFSLIPNQTALEKKNDWQAMGGSVGQNGNESRKFLFWAFSSLVLVGVSEAEWPSFPDVHIEASISADNNRRSCSQLLWYWIKQASLWPEVRRLQWLTWTFEAVSCRPSGGFAQGLQPSELCGSWAGLLGAPKEQQAASVAPFGKRPLTLDAFLVIA